MHVGPATLPPDLRAAVSRATIKTSPADVLAALTTIRKQTSTQAETGAPEEGSLRAMRVLLRGTPLIARLDFTCAPDERALALLATCALAVRRGGTARNRGRGRLALLLHNHIPVDYGDATFTQTCFGHFATEVRV